MTRTGWRGDREFWNALAHVAAPIAMQQFVMNALNAVDVLMIGQMGATSVAAVGLANQVSFLLMLFLFGVGSGSAIFSAQFWGRRDVAGLRKVLGLALLIGVGGGAIFSLIALFASETVIGFYSRDPEVIALGSSYLRIVAVGFVPIAITSMFSIVLRSTRHVKIPMIVSVGALSLKTVLAWGLIFGHFGLPTLGVTGAAVATLIARSLECAALLVLTYAGRLPAAARLHELFWPDRELRKRFVRTALPVVLNEIVWSLGITTYTAIYARIGTESVAAVNIASTIEGIALVPFIGIGNACAIILGNMIGSGDKDRVTSYARRFLALAVSGALLMGVMIFLIAPALLDFYRISPEAQGYGRAVLTVMSTALWLKAANMLMIVGILRSGGDTRFALVADTAPMWVLGVPCAMVGAFVLHLPVYGVVLMVLIADEAAKFALSIWRVRSGRWINLVVQPAGGS